MEAETLDRIEERLRRIEMMLTELRENGVKPIMSVDEVAEYTGYAKRYIYNLAQFRRIPHYKRDGRLLFKKDEVDQWLMENRVSTDDEINETATQYCQTNTQSNTY